MNLQKQPVIDALEISNWTRQVLEELHSSGIDAINATCAVWENASETFRAVAEWLERARENDDLIALATTTQDLRRIRSQGKVGILLGFQNTSPFEDDYRFVEAFHRLGVRIAQLTYNNQNLVGTGCFEDQDGGLTRYGRVIVSEMNRVGMAIDLSHVGDMTCRDAIEVSERPVAITHSNPRWFHDTPRNKPKDVIDSLVARDGVIGLCLYPTVSGGEKLSLDGFSRMAADMVGTYGAEHVGLGTDCTRGWDDPFVDWLRSGRWQPPFGRTKATFPAWPTWFSGPMDFPKVAEGLNDAGLSDAEIAAVMGGTWQQFFDMAFEPSGSSANQTGQATGFIEVQPREIAEYSSRSLYAAGADQEEARIAGDAVLLAERRSGQGLEMLNGLLAEDWTIQGLPSVRRTMQDYESGAGIRSCSQGDIRDSALAAAREYDSEAMHRAYAGPLTLSRARLEAFKGCGRAYLASLKSAQ